MAHSHSHSSAPDYGPPRRGLAAVLTVVVLAIAAAAIAAMVVLWPDPGKVPKDANPLSGEGVSTVTATVKSIDPFDCNSGGEGPDNTREVVGSCAHVGVEVKGKNATFVLDATRYHAGIDKGEKVKLIRYESDGEPTTYEFLDFQRGFPLTALALIFAVLVVVVARWRGLFALVGIAVTLLALTKFMLPAFLAGESPLVVVVVGSTAIMIAVLYLAHGVSIRTTSALFGTLFGIAMTAGMGVLATGWVNLTGVGSEDDQALIATVPDLHLSGIVAAAMVIAGLGVLNDVTVTQASAVWELRALQPKVRGSSIFASAMRIGRDHIASSVYTLVFAYAGSAMTVLLLITAYQRGLAEMATTEQLAQEIVRTLVGAIGLVLAVPVTTAIAVWLAPKAEEDDFEPAGERQTESKGRRVAVRPREPGDGD
ncbi:YibE/F family protein [Aeromicrobium panaciterrae]|uniref:YibE/F family protein n=1 Tax=Aeromicrobium panaciterrae TaxID=363861 RepID=UPI0031DA6055